MTTLSAPHMVNLLLTQHWLERSHSQLGKAYPEPHQGGKTVPEVDGTRYSRRGTRLGVIAPPQLTRAPPVIYRDAKPPRNTVPLNSTRSPRTRDPQTSLQLAFFADSTGSLYQQPTQWLVEGDKHGQLAKHQQVGEEHPPEFEKNTRTRRAPHRYGQSSDHEISQHESEQTVTLESESQQMQPSDYSDIPPSSTHLHQSEYTTPSPEPLQSEPSLPQNRPATYPQSRSPASQAISLNDMRELLRSHEDGIVNQVVHRLQSQNVQGSSALSPNTQVPVGPPLHQPPVDPTALRIAELENQLAQLRTPNGPGQGTILATRELEPLQTNQYLPIGGVEFEQAERDGKESEYRMSSFFKAWAAYSGILVKLAPHGLQGELATALFIYTMNLYDLLEKYTWDGVKSYHFQFHRKRVASGKSIYLPSEWQQVDSELIASKCFAHPITRNTWSQAQTPSRKRAGTGIFGNAEPRIAATSTYVPHAAAITSLPNAVKERVYFQSQFVRDSKNVSLSIFPT
ncbi:hypothetical protein HOY82DRAFT_598831 [Tuber indicum]|nr:hypothetical protein HOY82DRAFT_598831 [Tuber indicum]